MRLILSNRDARELEALISANPDAALQFAAGKGKRAVIALAGVGRGFYAVMRPTPSAPGSVVIEDFDGRRIAEAGER